MATLQAKKIKDALVKARSVGVIEEPLTVAGCEIVLQNMTPRAFESVLDDCDGLDDVKYANAYQSNQVARSIVELNGTDLRGVDYIEEEVPAGAFLVQIEAPNQVAANEIVSKLAEAHIKATVSPPDESSVRTIKLERHAWLRDYVLDSWSREAVTVTWRKVMELWASAEEKTKEGINFRIPDETDEEKFRRLLFELQETSENLPDEMIDKLLKDVDLVRRSSQEELDDVATKLQTPIAQVASPPPAVPQAPPPAPAAPQAAPYQPPPQATPEAASTPEQLPPAIQALMANRQSLSQQTTAPPPAPPAEPPLMRAQQRVPVPDQIRQAAQAASASIGRGEPPVLGVSEPPVQGATVPATIRQPPAPVGGLPTRAAQIAQLESQVDPSILQPDGTPYVEQRGTTELHTPQKGIDPSALVSITDRPPVVGVNKKFQPPNR